ncbi:hypothetical protein [Bacillus clarus]|uniref:Uncharacterized protein n=1 Tax=Bacillus clarus TaxID=2338372 RepID=A0A090Y9Z8_9BACI|nr:hypothetical protein [Bacillus clarus]KFM95016.1 hypothetical protein DJ93_5862 [Bacillus clarus]
MKKLFIILVVLLGVSIFVLKEQNTDYITQQKVKHLARMNDPGGGW